MELQKRLGKERLIFDGAMGTMLQDQGLTLGERPEVWNITHSGIILNNHKAYADVGCHILKANTFGANRLKLSDTGYAVSQIVSAGVSLAREAAGSAAYVALDIGPTGKLLAPFGNLDFEEAVDVFAEMVAAGTRAGADLVLIETMTDTYEIKAAMLAAKENCDLPIVVTFTPDAAGKLLTGGDILTAVCLMEGLGADALGLNCGLGPAQMEALLPALIQYASVPVIVSPNAGMPELRNGKTVYTITSEEFAHRMASIAARVQLMGGCCGTTPAHIAEMIRVCRDVPFTRIVPKTYTAVSSYGKTVVFGDQPVLIGERLNPTGKPRLKQALRDNDMDYLNRVGLDQIESGAEILDVNVGLPGIDKSVVLARVVTGLQRVSDAPLQIDTADPTAAERALRLYNGKPLLNSVSGKQNSLETILPLAKKYGAALVALTLDDDGIPDTAQGRVQIAEKIIASAAHCGIPPRDIVVDALTMTVCTDGKNARITLEAMESIREKLGVHTVLGISNVSFGLPEREHINAAFFTLAISRGLSAGIVNPLSGALMNAYYAVQALRGVNISEYIHRFSKVAAPAASTKNAAETETISLYTAIVKGLRERAEKAARALAGETLSMDIVNGHIIPALDKVGEDFEKNAIFLPQLLMSAEAAQSAFEVIRQQTSTQGETRKRRGKIVLATVKGDIHDIGKNIVKVLLENYDFLVIDLGKNVEPSVVAETVLKEQARLVGLSALMTTTVAQMEETVRLLRKEAPDCRVMVGGAVLTQEYADSIGADFYAKDAMCGVRYADRLMRSEDRQESGARS